LYLLVNYSFQESACTETIGITFRTLENIRNQNYYNVLETFGATWQSLRQTRLTASTEDGPGDQHRRQETGGSTENYQVSLIVGLFYNLAPLVTLFTRQSTNSYLHIFPPFTSKTKGGTRPLPLFPEVEQLSSEC